MVRAKVGDLETRIRPAAREAHRPIAVLPLLLSLGSCCYSNSDCDDGRFCNGAEVCSSFLCQDGTPPICDDSVACTVDSCDPALDECIAEPDDTVCSDGLWCDGDETCDPALGCLAGSPVVCGDGIDCTGDLCDEDGDRCDFTPDDGICDDLLFCNGQEHCDEESGCVVDDPAPCDDEVACTIDECDETGDSCANTPDDSACDDGLFCTGTETCDPTGGCIPGIPIECDDGVDCTVDECDPGLDDCLSTPDDGLCPADPVCKDYSCDSALGCVLDDLPDRTPCGEGEICVGGECMPQGCGDGSVEPLDTTYAGGPEECDDGNADPGDSCDGCESTDFQVNTSTGWAERSPSVASWPDGGFVVAFEDETYESPGWTDARFRRYDGRGNARDVDDRLLQSDTAGIEMQPAVVAFPGGGFAAAWAENPSDGDLFGIRLGLFDGSGDELDVVQANTSTLGSQTDPFVALDPTATEILLLWADDSPGGMSLGTVAMRRFDTDGRAIDADQVALPSGGFFACSEPVAAYASDGRFLVVWTHSETGAQTDLAARLFSSAGVAIGAQQLVTDTGAVQEYAPSIAWDEGSGLFVVAWEQTTASGSTEVAATLVDPGDLATIPTPVLVASPVASEEYFQPVAATAQLMASHYPIPDPSDPGLQHVVIFAYAGNNGSGGVPTDAPYDIWAHRWTVVTGPGGGLDVFDPDPIVFVTTTTFEQSAPSMAFGPSGSLVGAWTDFSREGSDVDYSAVRARSLPLGWVVAGAE